MRIIKSTHKTNIDALRNAFVEATRQLEQIKAPDNEELFNQFLNTAPNPLLAKQNPEQAKPKFGTLRIHTSQETGTFSKKLKAFQYPVEQKDWEEQVDFAELKKQLANRDMTIEFQSVMTAGDKKESRNQYQFKIRRDERALAL